MGHIQTADTKHPLELVIRATTPRGCAAPDDLKSRAREVLIDAVAAQLYTIEQMTSRDGNPKFWRDIDASNREHYRRIAQRKLKTGEIHGWPK